MKKQILAVCLSAATALSVCSFTACSKDEGAAETTRMTVDINPSVELMVDSDNKVISVTALNDDAAVILKGEASIVGMESDDAVKAVVSLATDTGYIVKGEVEADENTVKISVSGDTQWAKDLANDAEKQVNQFFEENNISGKVEEVEALKSAALKELAAKNSTYSEEEIEKMSDEQVLKVIALGRVETAEFLSAEMREAYFAAKTTEISFAESEATWTAIQNINSLYATVYAAYGQAVTSLGTAIQTLDDTRYSLLVDPDSDYQKLLTQMREKKSEIIKKKVEITVSTGDVKVTAEAELTALENAYDDLYSQLVAMGNTANQSITTLITTLKGYQQTLEQIYASLPTDLTKQLSEKAKDIETEVNKAKDAFFAEFEKEYADDIKAYNDALAATKENLKQSIDDSQAAA